MLDFLDLKCEMKDTPLAFKVRGVTNTTLNIGNGGSE